MNQENIVLSIFRILIYLGILCFLLMLYWSSALVEHKLKTLQEDVLQVKSDLLFLRNDAEKKPCPENSSPSERLQSNNPPHLELFNLTSTENLLRNDPFYTTILPKILGTKFTPHGLFKEASIGKPNDLHPFSNWSRVSTWNAMCTIALGGQEIGKYETYTPEMALSLELRKTEDGSPEYWVFLRKDVFWHPLRSGLFPEKLQIAPVFMKKHQVTAHDFKFYFDAIMNPHVEQDLAVALRNYYNDIEEVRVVDDFTLVVRWKTYPSKTANGEETRQMKYLAKSFTTSLRPLPRFVYQFFADGTKIVVDDENPNTYRTNPIWAQNFSHHWAQNVIVSCGPWIFDGMSDREIRFRRNSDYYNPYAALFENYDVKFRDSVDGIWQDFKTGSLDLFEIPPNLLTEFDQFLISPPYQRQTLSGLHIHRLEYLGRMYNYVGWNQKNPIFKSKAVRQALTMAIDRERIIRQNLNGMGLQITGPFFPFSPSYNADLRPYPFDPQQALQLLREEEWYDSDGDGILDKTINGKKTPFRFTLTYYVKNQTGKAICDYISTALKDIGIECNLNGVDIADLSAMFEDKNFDAIMMGWALATPPEDPKQLWYSAGATEKGSSNAIGFVNAEIDRIIDQLSYEHDPEKRLVLYHRFNEIIYNEAPYTFLYAPKITLAYRSYLQNVFIPAERQDLIPGANVGEPQTNIFWSRQFSS